jgi:muramoyltetrapeptide carboxypeptidase LdcA involved in peptidoglycan recycling
VLQSALGFAQAGQHVAVVADATGSRRLENHEKALKRLRHNDIEVVTAEMVLFEWLGVAGTDEFRELSKLIK